MTPRQKGIYEEIVAEILRQFGPTYGLRGVELGELNREALAIAIDRKLHG